MTPEQRLDRAEYILLRMAKSGREARSEFRQKINILIDAQIRHEAAWRAESEAINEQLKVLAGAQSELTVAQSELTVAQSELAVAQAELAKSQKLTDRALRAFINSLRKGGNGNS